MSTMEPSIAAISIPSVVMNSAIHLCRSLIAPGVTRTGALSTAEPGGGGGAPRQCRACSGEAATSVRCAPDRCVLGCRQDRGAAMPTIAPCLWFDTQGLEAAEFYVSLFENSEITSVTHYGEGGPRPAGSVMTVEFTLDGS